MRFAIGKFLELIGMVTLAIGFIAGVSDKRFFRYEEYCFAIGIAIFIIGWLLERKVRAQ